jgi:hypothetical protein
MPPRTAARSLVGGMMSFSIERYKEESRKLDITGIDSPQSLLSRGLKRLSLAAQTPHL